MTDATGVEILTTLLKNSESAVAAAPIIWFMTSQAALMLSSSKTKSSVGSSSLPISRFRMICISRCRKIITLLPEMPSTYSILTSMAGSSAA